MFALYSPARVSHSPAVLRPIDLIVRTVLYFFRPRAPRLAENLPFASAPTVGAVLSRRELGRSSADSAASPSSTTFGQRSGVATHSVVGVRWHLVDRLSHSLSASLRARSTPDLRSSRGRDELPVSQTARSLIETAGRGRPISFPPPCGSRILRWMSTRAGRQLRPAALRPEQSFERSLTRA